MTVGEATTYEGEGAAAAPRSSLSERFSSGLSVVKEKAAAAMEVVKPAVQSAAEKAAPVAQSVAASVRRGSTAAAGAVQDKFHESGMDEKLDKLASSSAVKTVESTAKSSIGAMSSGVNAQVENVKSALKSADFLPDASFTPILVGPKPLTMTAIRYGDGFAVASFANTDQISQFESLFSASDKPQGKVSVWRTTGENFVEVCEAVLQSAGTSLELVLEPTPIVYVGRHDGTVQEFALSSEGILSGDLCMKLHKGAVLNMKLTQRWTYRCAVEGSDVQSGVGRLLVTSSNDCSVRICNLESRTVLHQISFSGSVPAITPVSQTCVVIGSTHGQLVAMDFAALYPVAPSAVSDFPLAHQNGVRGVAHDTESRSVWSVGNDASVTAWKVNDAGRGITFHERYFGHTDKVLHVEWCAEAGANGVLATADDKGYVLLWPRNNPNMHVSIHAHSKSISCLSWCAVTSRLITGSDDTTIRAWDVNRILGGHRFDAPQVMLAARTAEATSVGGIPPYSTSADHGVAAASAAAAATDSTPVSVGDLRRQSVDQALKAEDEPAAE